CQAMASGQQIRECIEHPAPVMLSRALEDELQLAHSLLWVGGPEVRAIVVLREEVDDVAVDDELKLAFTSRIMTLTDPIDELGQCGLCAVDLRPRFGGACSARLG